MEDREIIELYWARSERAVAETAKKYFRYCSRIAYNILHTAEECVNDISLHAWNAMPPQRPNRLPAFLGGITRNLSLDKYKLHTAGKRGFGQTASALSEPGDCIPAKSNVEQASDEIALIAALNAFLAAEPKKIALFSCSGTGI